VLKGSNLFDQGDKLCGVTAAILDRNLGCLVGAHAQPRQEGVAGIFQHGSLLATGCMFVKLHNFRLHTSRSRATAFRENVGCEIMSSYRL
jgi:hypothetical protein